MLVSGKKAAVDGILSHGHVRWLRWFKICLVRRRAKPTLLILCEYLNIFHPSYSSPKFPWLSKIILLCSCHVLGLVRLLVQYDMSYLLALRTNPTLEWTAVPLDPKDLVLAWSKVPTDVTEQIWTVKQRQIKCRSLATTSPMHTIFAPYDFFCRSHINFISDILETKQNLNIARKTAEDLTRRLDLLVRNFDFMSEVLQSMEPSKAPSRIRRKLRRWAIHFRSCFFLLGEGWVKEKTCVWGVACFFVSFSYSKCFRNVSSTSSRRLRRYITLPFSQCLINVPPLQHTVPPSEIRISYGLIQGSQWLISP